METKEATPFQQVYSLILIGGWIYAVYLAYGEVGFGFSLFVAVIIVTFGITLLSFPLGLDTIDNSIPEISKTLSDQTFVRDGKVFDPSNSRMIAEYKKTKKNVCTTVDNTKAAFSSTRRFAEISVTLRLYVQHGCVYGIQITDYPSNSVSSKIDMANFVSPTRMQMYIEHVYNMVVSDEVMKIANENDIV